MLDEHVALLACDQKQMWINVKKKGGWGGRSLMRRQSALSADRGQRSSVLCGNCVWNQSLDQFLISDTTFLFFLSYMCLKVHLGLVHLRFARLTAHNLGARCQEVLFRLWCDWARKKKQKEINQIVISRCL